MTQTYLLEFKNPEKLRDVYWNYALNEPNHTPESKEALEIAINIFRFREQEEQKKEDKCNGCENCTCGKDKSNEDSSLIAGIASDGYWFKRSYEYNQN